MCFILFLSVPEIPVGPRFLNIPFDSAGYVCLVFWLSVRLSEFLPESTVYTDYKWPVHFSMKQVDFPIIGYDKYSRNSMTLLFKG